MDDDHLSTFGAHLQPGNVSTRKLLRRYLAAGLRHCGLRRFAAQTLNGIGRVLLDQLPAHKRARFGDLDFDLEHSVNTTRANVGFRTELLCSLLGQPYFASEPWLFKEIMAALPIDMGKFSFVDLGSGKGRALLMAANYPFQRIVGIEFMPELERIARSNISRYSDDGQKCWSIESVCMDALDFQFPAVPLVVYIFNPFTEATFIAVLKKLHASVERCPRPVFIAYRSPEFDHLLQQCSWLTKLAGTEQWSIYGNGADQ